MAAALRFENDATAILGVISRESGTNVITQASEDPHREQSMKLPGRISHGTNLRARSMPARQKSSENESLPGHGVRMHITEKQGIYKVGYKRPPVHTQFKKGVSGNPRGVKKGTVFISEVYKRMIAMSPEDFNNYEAKSLAEEIAIRHVRDALRDSPQKRSLRAVKEIMNRTEGKAPQGGVT